MDPQRALETWDEGVAYVGEHDVRFFEGFLARDAALLHTSDGQLETALTLFDAAIGAFLRAGAVAQLTITVASLPALFERLGRPAVAGTLLGAMSRQPAGFHHVPSLADLELRLRESLGQERAGPLCRQRCGHGPARGGGVRPAPGRRGLASASPSPGSGAVRRA